MLSVIVPAFNEQAGLAVTFKTLEQALAPIAMPFEILFPVFFSFSDLCLLYNGY